MYTVKEVEGQPYTNRVRWNIARIMQNRGMSGFRALPSISQSGLYKLVGGGGDITVTRLAAVADDLGVSIFELLQHPDMSAYGE